MQSIREAIHNLEQSNERQFGQTAAMSNCERCLKGRRGKVDGTFVWKEEDADSVQVIYVCPNRHDCEKLLQYKDGLIDRLKEKSGMSPDLLRKTVSGFMAEEPYQKVLRSVTANYVMNAFSKFGIIRYSALAVSGWTVRIWKDAFMRSCFKCIH